MFISNFYHVVNAGGMCMFGACCSEAEVLPEFLSAVMGKEYSMDRVLETGWRIASMRMAFTVREGNVPPSYKIPSRMIGKPAFASGPHKGITLDNTTQSNEYLEAMGWDVETARPSAATLAKLGLDSVVK